MNYLAHARTFLDRPYFAAGTAVPDWLTVSDRGVRMRTKIVDPFLAYDEPVVAEVAGGILQHLRDDARFHATPAFIECTTAISRLARRILPDETGFRLGFLGHLLTEVLLDAALADDDRTLLPAYEACLSQIEPRRVAEVVNLISPRPAVRLAAFIEQFLAHRILWDYSEDGKLLMRLNQVMRRVGLEPLPAEFLAVLPEARRLVADRRVALLAGTPAPPPS
ncbi:MAG: hypothetical protein ACOY3P_01210 [Planctomycetota bacterium]